MPIDEHIERGHTIVCANVRLVHHFSHRYAREQLRQGRRAWETPDILPWQAWLRRCRDSRGEHHDTLLTTEQENMLWQQIIEASDYKNSLLQISSVAGQAAAAWQVLKQYKVPIFPDGMFLNEDTSAFRAWANEYRLRCQRNNWTDNASLADTVPLDAATNPDAFGRHLVLAGFDRLTPQQTILCEKLRTNGVAVQEYRPENRNESAQVADFADVDEEIRAAAVWARRCIEEEGEVTVGIITPDLRKLRTRIRYIFEDVLAPEHLRYRNESVRSPFSISVGQSLTDYPLVHVIFPLLGLSKAPLPLDVLDILLRSPFIRGYDQEQSGRALLDQRLRSRKQPALSWGDLFYLAGNNGESDRSVPVLAGMLRETRALLEELPGRQSPEAWAGSFTRLLEILGWPGERTPDSAEYQLVRAWHKALDGLASLRLVTAQMSRAEALTRLRRIAESAGFQPETAETPIQVLDPHGAAAMAFDRVWMLGLSEESWPPRPHPNPFIPLPLQKQYGIPYADAADALERSRGLQQALVRSATHVILSHARLDADRPLLVSPLLQGLAPVSNPALQQTPDTQDQPWRYSSPDTNVIFNGRRLELIEDTHAPPVAGQYGAGGAALFQDQSQCPFRAFARRRLDSRGLDNADIGTDALQRGELLHDLMQNVWSDLRSQARLKAMTEAELEAFIRAQTCDLLQTYHKRYPLVYTPRFADIEAGRLSQVLREWLELELLRAPFTVAEVEARTGSEVGGVAFSARLDRVDVLEDGRRVIIDYKSGRDAAASKWAGARPDEPQLPLYAITHPETVAALTFARLRRGKQFGFEGLAEDGRLLPGTAEFTRDRRAKKVLAELKELTDKEDPTWQDLLHCWRRVLENLAREFREGVATVTPSRNACNWCDQKPLCRIHEVNEQALDPDDD